MRSLIAAVFLLCGLNHASGQTYLSVGLNQAPLLVADAGVDLIICPGDSISIGASPSSTGGTSPHTYAWSPSGGLTDPSTSNPVASPAATETYTLMVTDSAGCTASDDVIVLVDTCVSVLDPMAGITMNLFPNPSTGKFKVEVLMPALNNVSGLKISALDGKILLDLPGQPAAVSQSWDVDLSRYGAGTYLIGLEINGRRITKKIIIQ